ncbi:MAG: hypothetical protein JSR26_02315 [Proteobacteria bacterium]|nr:hypothetical protein [Pseudomonadota bacterium]
MTSFEQPDAGLLVEHLLPTLLGANHSISQELHERTLFFGELGTALEMLRGRLTLISSPSYGAREESQYPWLWRYVTHFNVGAEERAIQHAKLWAFHWKVNNEEILDLHVSSTNLTPSAFKSQLQAGWQTRLVLGERSSQNTRRTWGALIPFLEALGASSGVVAATRFQRLVGLLCRVQCPEGVTFVASIPGQASATRQLAHFKPTRIHVLAPTIGEWNERTLTDWSSDVGVSPSKIHMKWISEDHPWATNTGWALSKTASANLDKVGVRLDCLPKETRFTEQHHDGDPRWCHAKLYVIRTGRKRRLLITSANWSAAAWGAGRLKPRNFELGVLIDSDWTGLEAISAPFDPPNTTPFCVDRVDGEENICGLEWAQASWDGEQIALRARSTDGVTPIRAVVAFTSGASENASLDMSEASMPWSDSKSTPHTAHFVQGTYELEVDVLDLRPPSKFAKTPLPEVDPAVEKALREAFLLQRYGGPSVDAESVAGLRDEYGRAAVTTAVADYTVKAWVEARAAFSVVDKWRDALAEATADVERHEQVRLDGEELRALFARCEGPGSRLVVEEISWRLV